MEPGLNLIEALKSPRIAEILRSRRERKDTELGSRLFFTPELILVFKGQGNAAMGEFQVHSCNPQGEQVVMSELAGWPQGHFKPSRNATSYTLRTWNIREVNLVRRSGKSFVEITLKRKR